MKTKNWFPNKIVRSLVCFVLLAGAANSYAQVTVSGAVSGNGTYATLGAAFTAIGTAQASANIVIDITANTTEAAGGAVLGAGNWTTVTIRPSGGAARTISGAATAGVPLIDFNGADNVTINGLNTGGNSLTISNTTVSANSGTSTIQFRADAAGNTITNCTVLGSSTMAVGTNGGNIFFGTGTTTGNDNNTVSNCNIGPAGTNLPTKGIYMNGSTATTAINNSGNTFTANNIYDFFGAAVASAGVYISSGNTDNSITSNKFYQTAARTHTSSAQHSAIWINNTSGNNFQVTGNTIGYASPSATGIYTFTGVSSSYMIPIFISVGTTTATAVSTNTITAMAVSGAMNGTTSSSAFRIIYIGSGLATCNDNIIGSQTATGAITYTSSSSSNSDVSVIYNFGTSNWTTNNNIIGGITASNSSTGASNIYAIRCNTSSSVTWICNNNTVGGTVANSISSTSTSTSTLVNGILNSSPAGTFTGNVVRNMTAAAGTGTTTSASVSGIVINAGSTNHTLSQNSVYNLSNTNTGASGAVVNGIYYASSTGANLIERNLVYSLSAATSAVSNVNGIYMSSGTATFQNNMVRLGIDGSGPITAGQVFYGFNLVGGTNSVYHNSVYIGGTGVGGSAATYAMYNNSSSTRNFRNNIFVNERSNGAGTGKHYAIRETSATSLTINYNIYVASGTGGVLGNLAGTDRANLAAWQTATSQDANSLSATPGFISPTTATPDLHINTSITSPADMTGTAIATVANDFDNDARSGLTPTDIGADAFNGLVVACTAPVNQPTGLTLTSVTNTTLSGAFTAAVPAADNYIVVRSTSSTLSATPSNTTTYTVGTALGGGTVIMVGSGTTFSETGLSPATTYYYFVFAYNSLCSGGPTYNTTTPLTNNATTCLNAPTSSAATGVTLTGFTANWAAVASATGYLLDVSTSNTFATFVSGYNGLPVGNVTSYALTGLTTNTTYYYRVRATGSVCTSTNSSTQTIYIGYCTYNTTYSDATGITNVTFNTINNTTTGTPAYVNFLAQSTTVQQGQSYNLSVLVNTDGSYTVRAKAWIDWNQNGVFDASEEYDLGGVYNNANGAPNYSPLSITIPGTALVGSTVMRVVATEVSDPYPLACGTQLYGEAEDYTITVTAAPNCTGSPVAGTSITNNSQAICISAGVRQLTLNGSAYASGITYQWKQSATSGSGYTNVTGGSGATTLSYTTPGLTQTTYYVCETTCSFSGISVLSSEVAVLYSSPSVISTTPASVCGSTPASLQATVSTGTPTWYNVSTGGSSVGTGTTYTTPSLSATTDYWVEASSTPSSSIAGLTNFNSSNGTFSSSSTVDLPLRLTTTMSGAIESFQFFPDATGVYTFQLRTSGTATQVAGTTNASVTVNTLQFASLVTVTPTDWVIPPGNYQITAIAMAGDMERFSTFTGTYPMNGYGISIVGSATSSTAATNTTTYNTAFNVKFTTSCASTPRIQVTAAYTAPPALTLSTAAVSNCAGQPSATTVTVSTGAASYDAYAWPAGAVATGNSTSGWNLNPTVTGTYNLTSTNTTTGCAKTTPVAVTVKPVPASVTATPSLAAVCPGGSVNLSSTPGALTFSHTQPFATNSMPTGWASIVGAGDQVTFSNTTTAGGAAARELRFTGNSSPTGNATTIVYYGPINSAGMTSISLQWRNFLSHYSNSYNYNVSVVTSTDLSTWTNTSWVTNPVTANQTAGLQSTTINTADVGSANLYIGFKMSGLTFGMNTWNIDDVVISGAAANTYAWTSSPAGFTSSVQNPTGVTPSANTTYTVTVTNSAGCSASNSAAVAINTATPANIATATGATLAAGDLLWNGYSSTVWSTASNWYEYNGSAFAISTNVPTPTTRVFVLPSSTTNACISGSNNTTVSAGGDANNVFIGTGATLLVNSGQTLNVTGHWTNNGTFTQNVTGVVNFTGGNAQTIGGSSAGTFTNMTVDKSANAITLGTPVSVSGTLKMTAGNINTSNANLLTVGSSAALPGLLDWTAGTVIGPLKRFMSGTASSTQTSGIFPVGNGSWNRYAQVNYNSDPGTGGFITAEYKSGACPIGISGLPATINGLLITNYENEGYWEITPTGGNLNTTPYDLVLRGNHLSTVNDVNALRIIKSSGHTSWNDNVSGDGNHVAATGTTSDFTIGASAMLGFSWFNIGADDINPLPVTLTSFSANCGDGVELKWSTASEQNSQAFIVERSRDMNSWSQVSTHAAAGNSNHNINYKTVDHHAFGGTSYYRLVQVDNDGVEKVFGPISVSCGELENSMIVFPNPANGAFTVQISSTSDISSADIMVLDLTGKVVATHNLTIHEGNNQVMFDHIDLKKGTYIVNVVSESEFTPVRVVVN